MQLTYFIYIYVYICLWFTASWLIGYLYLRRQPLSWTQSLYGYYVGVLALVHGVALVAIMPLMKKVMKVTDTGILIFATILQAVAEAFFGFCTKTWMVFLGEWISLVCICTFIVTSGRCARARGFNYKSWRSRYIISYWLQDPEKVGTQEKIMKYYKWSLQRIIWFYWCNVNIKYMITFI